jgi:hypothetical protein
MNTTNSTPKPATDATQPTELTAEQAAQVGGGLLTATVGHICCMTCASVGLPKFAMLAATV